MPVTIFVDGIPVTDKQASSIQEATQSWHEFEMQNPDEAARILRASARQRQNKTGLTDEDIEAIVSRGQSGHRVEEPGALEKLRIGAGRSATEAGRSVMQMARTVAPGLADVLGIKEMDELERDEENARELFAQLDEGVGMEDAGEMLFDTLLFVGGGSVGIGRSILGRSLGAVGGGALVGAMEATTKEDMRSVNAAMGGAIGLLGPMFVGGTKAAYNLVRQGGATAWSLLSAASAAARGGRGVFLASSAMSRAHVMASMAARDASRGVRQALTPAGRKAATEAEIMARKARDELGNIIGKLRPRHQDEAAFAAAETAMQRGFRVNNAGQQEWIPAEVTQALSVYTNAQLKKMGRYGQRLAQLRDFARIAEEVPDMSPEMYSQAFATLATNPAARSLLPQLERAVKDTTRQRIIRQIIRRGGQAAGNVARQVPAGGISATAIDNNPLM